MLCKIKRESRVPQPNLKDWKREEDGNQPLPLPFELAQAISDLSALDHKFQHRLDERRARQVAPEILYHYTDLRGLHGMLESLTMWLSDAAYMNDPLEGSWVHYRAKELAPEILGASPLADQVKKQIESQLTAPDLWDKRLREGGISDDFWAAMEGAYSPAFIASFTEEDDLLSQWRGYGAGGDGVSIGFDLTKLGLSKIEHSPHQRVLPKLVKVEYEQSVQDNEIRWILSETKKVYDKHIPALSTNPDAADYFTLHFRDPLRNALYWLRWEFKSPHYSEEKEWRLVANPMSINRRRTRVTNGGIVPYLEMPLPQTPCHPLNQLAIPRIVLGPRCPQSALRSIRGLLQNLAYPTVERSRLALR